MNRIRITLGANDSLEASLTHKGKTYAIHGGAPGDMAEVLVGATNLDPKRVKVEFENVLVLRRSRDLAVVAGSELLSQLIRGR